MTQNAQLLLEKYMFPVEERPVAFSNKDNDDISFSKDHKAIVRSDTNELISIQKNTYRLVKNADIIKPLMKELHLLDTPWFIDKSHSYVENARMRLMITYPQLLFHDGKSDISLSLFIENSMDSSISVRTYVGGIRARCSNGMVFGEILEKYYHKHTHGFSIKNLKETVHSLYEKIPVIQHRIEQMQNSKVTKELRQGIENKLGKKVYKFVQEEESTNQKANDQWVLYNMLTFFISRYVDQRMRAQYQFEVSKLFKL